MLDEAYKEFVTDPEVPDGVEYTRTRPNVMVLRTFSKAYGLAGLRVGYALGQADALRRMARLATPLALNVLGVAAARASLADASLVGEERRLNSEARSYTQGLFARAGYRVIPSATNFLMVNVRRDAREFQEACRKGGVLVGRPFPPLETWSRVSIGTMDEMRAGGEIMLRVLKAAT